MDMLEWYFPWTRIDALLKIELLIWLASVGASLWVAYRSLVLKRPWLPMRHLPNGEQPPRSGPKSAP